MKKHIVVTAAAALLFTGLPAAVLPHAAEAGGLGGLLGSVVGAILGGSSDSSAGSSSKVNPAIPAASRGFGNRYIDREPNTNERMFFVALDQGDTATVANMMERGVDVNAYYTNWGATPLGRAMRNDNRAMMQFLLEHGADVRGYNDSKNNYTPQSYLVQAVERGDFELVRYLHNWGADINSVSSNWNATSFQNALFFITGSDRADICRYLVAEGIDVNFQDGNRATPLMRVAQMWYLDEDQRHELLRILVEAGAKTYVKDSSGHTAIDYCLSNHDLRNAQYLQQF